MQVKLQPFGRAQTNCYIIIKEGKELIVDPGEGAFEWLKSELKSPLAILNTHGHYDHVWDNSKVQKHFNIPLYTPQADCFMLTKSPLGMPTPPSHPDIEVAPNSHFSIGPFELTFHHFPGHTPGCSAIEIDDIWLSGDFLFKGSIGRWDFPYSDGDAMIKSLTKAMQITKDFTLYPGHGLSTTLRTEQATMGNWIRYIEQNR